MIGTRSYEAYEQTGFATGWTVSGDEAGRTVTLPLVETRAEGALTYDCTVDWGDGTTSAITAFDDADRVHIYSEAGTYLIEITGTCEGWGWSFDDTGDRIQIRRIINWGGDDFDGWLYLKGGFWGCPNLVSLGDTTIKPSGAGIGADGFYATFYSCTGLTSIPTDLFRYNTAVSTSGFSTTFSNCIRLTSIPIDLFRYNTAVSTSGFSNTFYGCRSITAIPTDLFKYNTAVSTSGIRATFHGCRNLTSIPTDLFRYNTAVSTNGFYDTFSGCTGLTSIPTDLFRYNTAVSTSGFYYTFSGCSSLTSIPTDLFRYNTAVSTSGFARTFYGCIKLQLNANIFYAEGEETTRFLNRVSDFALCFSRTSFTGTQGTAPTLWDCDFGTVTPVTTDCFDGAGNSATSLTNYADIPAGWK